jgi:hypothetical protein
MKSINVLTAAILFSIPNFSFAEHRISKSDLSVVVSKTADAQSDGAIVVGYAKDVEKGKTEYEVQLMVDERRGPVLPGTFTLMTIERIPSQR